MKYLKWIGIGSAILLVIACFMPWYHLGWKDLTISGVEGGGKFGKPGYWHFVFGFFFLFFSLIPKIWAKQWNLLIVALNVAWMIRNFFMLAICSGGDCPQRQYGIWLLFFASLLMLLSALFPGMRIPQHTNAESKE
ncbi:MAG TPA: hypothetical protein PKC72_08160 [Chitinophagaceae bacterium]|nr:hypothetical protein [Chitinophagaceae bacterium]